MPNWCENYLELRGPKDQIEGIIEAATSTGFFNHVVPLSDDAGIGSAVEAWGTKWDVTDADILESEDLPNEMAEVQLSFMTAWCPPIEVYEALCDKGFVVYGMYYEPGCLFCGVFEDEEDHEYPIDIDNTEFFEVDEHGIHIDEMYGIVDDLKSYNEELESYV